MSKLETHDLLAITIKSVDYGAAPSAYWLINEQSTCAFSLGHSLSMNPCPSAYTCIKLICTYACKDCNASCIAFIYLSICTTCPE